MIVNEEKKTSPKQRIIIVLIAILMLGSTFALYAGIVLQYQGVGAKTVGGLTTEEQDEMQNLMYEYQQKVNAQADELSAKYYDTFKVYRDRVRAYNAADVTQLKVTDLKVGDGRQIEDLDDVDYAAYYIGWLSDEKVFDSSFDNYEKPTKLSSPLPGSTNLIQGWLEGVAKGTEEGYIWDGMRIGGVREIAIPSVLGYGSEAQNDIPANSPLKFVVMLVEKPEEIEYPARLEELYSKMYGLK